MLAQTKAKRTVYRTICFKIKPPVICFKGLDASRELGDAAGGEIYKNLR
jgi:hypothetical protein